MSCAQLSLTLAPENGLCARMDERTCTRVITVDVTSSVQAEDKCSAVAMWMVRHKLKKKKKKKVWKKKRKNDETTRRNAYPRCGYNISLQNTKYKLAANHNLYQLSLTDTADTHIPTWRLCALPTQRTHALKEVSAQHFQTVRTRPSRSTSAVAKPSPSQTCSRISRTNKNIWTESCYKSN